MYASLAALALAGAAVAAPVKKVSPKKNLATDAPHQVIYLDAWVNQGSPPASSDLGGFNNVLLSFWLTSGAADMALGWTQLDAATQQSVKSDYSAAGVNLLVSAFGSTDLPVSAGADPTATADSLAQFVTDNSFDGVDVDFEDLDAMNGGTAEAWLITFTTELRNKLPSGQYIITHAPLAPWFTTNGQYSNGAYTAVNSQVGSMIDWYNIQFYNQNDYSDCNSLITTSASSFTGTALMEIISGGVDSSKAVVGKPATATDANNGYIDPSTLAGCISTAKASGWNAGIMFWEWHDSTQSSLVSTVWGS